MHFPAIQYVPPTHSHWSLTNYDNTTFIKASNNRQNWSLSLAPSVEMRRSSPLISDQHGGKEICFKPLKYMLNSIKAYVCSSKKEHCWQQNCSKTILQTSLWPAVTLPCAWFLPTLSYSLYVLDRYIDQNDLEIMNISFILGLMCF